MYIILETRSDIIYFISKLNQYTSNPNPIYIKILHKIFKYIKYIINYKLIYNNNIHTF
jgi:hypothetical protein